MYQHGRRGLGRQRHFVRINRFSVGQIQLIVAAVCYEIYDSPVMSDRTFDLLAQSIEDAMKEKFPKFASYTGQWVHELIEDDHTWTKAAKYVIDSLEEGETLHHPLIESFLKENSIKLRR